MNIEPVKCSDLSEDPANARLHSDRNLESIKASLRRFGQQKPIVVDVNGVVRAGNGTLAAARSLGWSEVDCVVTELEGAEATAYAIADNRTAELADWDKDVLATQLEALAEEDTDLLAATGHEDSELTAMLIELMAKDKPEGDDEDIDDDESDDEQRTYVTFSIPLTVNQEKVMRDAVSLSKKHFEADTTAAAVVAIVQDWVSANASE